MITCIIPVYNLDEERKRNLEFIYKRLIEAEIEVVIAIQENKINNYYKKFDKAKLINCFKNENKNNFNKSFVFNFCIKNINFNSDFVLFLDADVYLPFKELKEKIKEDDQILQPFFDCFYISEEKTKKFISEKEVEITPEIKRVSCLGSCALIIKKNVLNRIEFDENFYSWGIDDLNLGQNSRHLRVRTIVQSALHLHHKKYIEKKITHVFNCEKNFNKNVIDSYINFSKNKNIDLINCAEENHLADYDVAFKKCTKYSQGYYFVDLMEAAAENCEGDEWILYTNSDFEISEFVYPDISNCKKNYIELTGCAIDDTGAFLNSLALPNGFAFRKDFLSSFYYPKIFTKSQNWDSYISDYFRNIKKHTIEDQLLKIKNKQTSKIEKFYKSNKILYFAPHAPDPYSSGGDRILKILNILKELNYEVHFFCNLAKNEKDLDNLEKMGVYYYLPDEEYLMGSLKKLRKQNEDFNYAIFSWYDMASQYLDVVKQIFPEIKTVMDTVDVHWKRESRGIELKEIFDTDKFLERKEEEKRVYSISDVVFVVTDNDKREVLSEIGQNNNVKILSNIHEETEGKLGGNDIIFIGSFEHTPNITAAKASIKIYNKFLETEVYKNLSIKPKLYIVGKGPPEEIVEMCDQKNSFSLGKVENLNKLYDDIKVSISPLTWGAGIKGKICDAASRGKIILTSDIGNEGINLIDGSSGFIANKEEDFVEKLIKIYSAENIESIAKKGKQIVQSLVSKKAAESVLIHTLKAKEITIVIVTYNKGHDLERCLNSIIKNTEYPNYKIVVYDNNSTDQTEEIVTKIQKDFKNIDYIKNTTNDYFVIPNNKIMKSENYINSDIVLVNNDIEILTKCWLSQLYSTAYSEYNICAVGGKILYPDQTIAEAGAELYSDGSGKNIGRDNDKSFSEYNYQRSVGYCSGCLLYMRRDAISKIGVFDEDFAPMYYEESEWQYRAHLFGLKTIYEPKVEAIHHESKFKEMKKHQKINKNKFVKKYIDKNIEQYN